MNSLLFLLSKFKYSFIFLLVGLTFLIAPMSTKEEKPDVVLIIGVGFIVLSVISFIKKVISK